MLKVESDELLVVITLEEESDEELRKLVEIVADDETLKSDVDKIVLELPCRFDEGSTTILAPQTAESLLPVPIAFFI